MSGKKNLNEGNILYFGFKVCKKNWYEKSPAVRSTAYLKSKKGS